MWVRMSLYIAGVDGGGTKTAMEVWDLEGNLITEAVAGPLNYNSQTKEEICKTLDALLEVLKGCESGVKGCQSLCLSTAGVSNKEAVSFLESYLFSKGISCPIHIVGDHEAALYGAIGGPEGIVLISGTGSICFGRTEAGSKARVGGYGHLIDDEGSGYSIGRDLLSGAIREYDKRAEKGVLLHLVLEEIGGNSVKDIIGYTYHQNWSKTKIAKMAPLLLKALEQKDEQAVSICNKAVDELGKLVMAVAKELHLEEGSLALLGGILKHYKPIREGVIQKLHKELPKLQIMEAKHESVTGAALIALNHYKEL